MSDAATDDLFRVKVLVEQLGHALKPGLLHRKDQPSPRPDGRFQTPGNERPHEPWCVPCQFWAVLDPDRDLRAKP